MKGDTCRLNDLGDQLFRLVNFGFGVCHDQAMQVLFLVAGSCSVGAALAFLDGTLAADGDLRAGLLLHLLERVSTRADEKANC